MTDKHDPKPLTVAFTDIETGGVDEDQDDIVEIGVLRVVYPVNYFATTYEGPEPEETEVSVKIQPTRPLDPEAAEINGYTPERWEGAVTLAEGLAQIYPFIKGARFACWNPFDQKFIARKFKQLGWRWPKGTGYRIIDVQTLCFPYTLQNFPDPIRVNQQDIARMMGILKDDEEQAHEGLKDAKLNRQMFDYMTQDYYLTHEPPAPLVAVVDPASQLPG